MKKNSKFMELIKPEVGFNEWIRESKPSGVGYMKKYLMEKGLEIMSIIVTLISGLIGYFIGRLFGWANLIFLGLYIAVLWFAYRYFRNKKINDFLAAIIVWSNVLTWLFPPLGIFMGTVTIGLANNTEYKNKKRYKILALISLTLTIINIAVGAYQGFMEPI